MRIENRCDATCSADALVRVEKNGMDLVFCGHCFDVRIAALFAAGFRVREDQRPALRDSESRRR